jgi:uncharacterized protein DUF481
MAMRLPVYGAPRALAMLGWLLASALAAPAAAQKTDIVVLDNGDHLTGEIKGLSAGQLDYSTDDVGRIYIEWDKIARITSSNYFELQVTSGRKYYGRLDPPTRDKHVVVARESADTLDLQDIVTIVPISAQFVNRLKAYLDLGFSLAKANKATTLNLSSDVSYRGPKLSAGVSFDSYVQGQTGVTTTTRNTIQLNAARLYADRWQAGGLAQFDQNDELGLSLRVTAGGEVARIYLTNASEFKLGAGLVVTRERFVVSDSTGSTTTPQDNLEGTINLIYDAFRYDSPKLDFSTELTVYPSISSPGRVRSAFTGRIKYEVFKDFFAGINFTDNFDSRPPEGAEKNDYVSSLTIGWSFRR